MSMETVRNSFAICLFVISSVVGCSTTGVHEQPDKYSLSPNLYYSTLLQVQKACLKVSAEAQAWVPTSKREAFMGGREIEFHRAAEEKAGTGLSEWADLKQKTLFDEDTVSIRILGNGPYQVAVQVMETRRDRKPAASGPVEYKRATNRNFTEENKLLTKIDSLLSKTGDSH